jgi:hypothetical protein
MQVPVTDELVKVRPVAAIVSAAFISLRPHYKLLSSCLSVCTNELKTVERFFMKIDIE